MPTVTRSAEFTAWLSGLRDATARTKIETALARMEAGNFSNCRRARDGVQEREIDYGPGYRVYFIASNTEVYALTGGDKTTQTADINAAIAIKDEKTNVANHQGREDSKRDAVSGKSKNNKKKSGKKKGKP